MPQYVRVNTVWREVGGTGETTCGSVNVGGTWYGVYDTYVNISGVWTSVCSKTPPTTTTTTTSGPTTTTTTSGPTTTTTTSGPTTTTTTTSAPTEECGPCQAYSFTQPVCNGEDSYVGNFTGYRRTCTIGGVFSRYDTTGCASSTFTGYGACIAVNVSSCGGSGGSGSPCGGTTTTTAAPTTTTTAAPVTCGSQYGTVSGPVNSGACPDGSCPGCSNYQVFWYKCSDGSTNTSSPFYVGLGCSSPTTTTTAAPTTTTTAAPSNNGTTCTSFDVAVGCCYYGATTGSCTTGGCGSGAACVGVSNYCYYDAC